MLYSGHLIIPCGGPAIDGARVVQSQLRPEFSHRVLLEEDLLWEISIHQVNSIQAAGNGFLSVGLISGYEAIGAEL